MTSLVKLRREHRAAGYLLNDAVLEGIRQRFAAFGLPMPERNSRQAMVIDGAEVLDNPNGSAPGLFMEHQDTSIALLPGPPREMRPMFEKHVHAAAGGKGGRRARGASYFARCRNRRIGGR